MESNLSKIFRVRGHPVPPGSTIIMMEIWICFWPERKVMENTMLVYGKIKEEMPVLKRSLQGYSL